MNTTPYLRICVHRIGLYAFTLAVAAIGFGTAAHAGEARSFYLGATLGGAVAIASDEDVDDNKKFHGHLSAGVFTGLRLGALPIHNGWPVYAELGYQDIARNRVSYQVPGGSSELTASGHSTYLAVKIEAPLTDRWSLYGKLGVARNTVEGSTPAGQVPINISGSKTSPMTGFGVQYSFDSGLSLRAELTDFGKTSANSHGGGISAGVAYGF